MLAFTAYLQAFENVHYIQKQSVCNRKAPVIAPISARFLQLNNIANPKANTMPDDSPRLNKVPSIPRMNGGPTSPKYACKDQHKTQSQNMQSLINLRRTI